MEEGIMVTDTNKIIIHVNPAFEAVTGYKCDEVIGQSPRILQSTVHNASFFEDMNKAIEEQGQWSGEIWSRRKNGEIYPEWLQVMEIRDESGLLMYYCSIFGDLSNHEDAVRQLKDTFMTDTLTQVGNRQSIVERMGELIAAEDNKEAMHAVFFLDLDRFKQINDTLGHAVGDELLKEFARRLRKVLKNKDILARLGGDEFVITQTGLKDPREATILAERIIGKLETPHQIGSYELYISSSIGISFYPHDGKTLDELLKKSDLAMYESKRNGRNNYTIFYNELEKDTAHMIELEKGLLNAIEHNAFSVNYQPKVDLKTARIVGVEAIVTCDISKYGVVDFHEFQALAENIGLIIPITTIVLEKVCMDILEMNRAGIETGPVAVNLSAIYFMQPHFIDSMMAILERYAISPHQLELELCESTILADREQSIRKLSKLKSLGFTLTVDHFGNGYSSLSDLPKLSLDFLKIDKSFVQQIFEVDDNRTIIDMIIHLAHHLGIGVIADGVEDASQMKIIKKMGCDVAQGPYMSEAVSKESLGKISKMFEARELELDKHE